jgi:hypothetical protein
MSGQRVTLEDIEVNIEREVCFTAAEGLYGPNGTSTHKDDSLNSLTICILVLRNGTKIVGINYGAIDPAQHDPALGRTEARKSAIEQIWPLLGYELRTKLADASGQA